MPKILAYKKITTRITTYTLVEPDTQDETQRITELCTIDSVTYVSIPDGVVLPDQPECLDITEATLTDELKAAIKVASPHVQLIDQRVSDMIRKQYSVNDEFKMLRLAPSEESALYNDYVEECRAWGRLEKGKLGL